MKAKSAKQHNTFSVPAIFKEVKQTVSVFLNEQGIHMMKATPYIRDNSYIACSHIIDDTGLHYLTAQVRYYKNDSTLPKYAYLAIPHAFVKYMVSESPFFERNSFIEIGKAKKN
jgi:hypothetical protein